MNKFFAVKNFTPIELTTDKFKFAVSQTKCFIIKFYAKIDITLFCLVQQTYNLVFEKTSTGTV